MLKYKDEIFQEKAHGYHFNPCKSLANNQLHGVSLQFLIELVAKLHEHQEVKYDVI